MSEKAITVRDLIEQLQKLPQDAPVHSDGCDCEGEARGAKLYDFGNGQYVLIERL